MKIKENIKNNGLSDKGIVFLIASLPVDWANKMPDLEDKEAYADIVDKYYRQHNLHNLCERPWRNGIVEK